MGLQLTKGDKAPDFTFDTPWKKGKNFYHECGDRTAVLRISTWKIRGKRNPASRGVYCITGQEYNVFTLWQDDPGHTISNHFSGRIRFNHMSY